MRCLKRPASTAPWQAAGSPAASSRIKNDYAVIGAMTGLSVEDFAIAREAIGGTIVVMVITATMADDGATDTVFAADIDTVISADMSIDTTAAHRIVSGSSSVCTTD